MPLAAFCPTELDCEEWVKTAKQAGATYAVLVCKHHDGFANWPSKYTDYSVANTSWKEGKGDIVRDYVDACLKYGLKVGLYYSPAQFGSDKMNADEYDDYFINQVSELLMNYGKIVVISVIILVGGTEEETRIMADLVSFCAAELNASERCVVEGMSCGGIQGARLVQMYPELVNVRLSLEPILMKRGVVLGRMR